MMTPDDINKLVEFFATKQELQDMFDKCATKEDLQQLRILVEEVLGEVRVTREEMSVISQHMEDSNARSILQNDRLDKIESTPTIAHELKAKD